MVVSNNKNKNNKNNNNKNNNKPIIIPIKAIDFDKFITKFKKEMNVYIDKLKKSKNYNNNLDSNKKVIDKLINDKKFSKKQLKDISILYDILDKRDVIDEIINARNKLFIKKLQKMKFNIKISEENTYKLKKKNIIKSIKWKNKSYDLLEKNGKKYFSVNQDLYFNDYDSFKKLRLISDINIMEKLKIYKKLNKFTFVPKICEIILIKNKDVINQIKIISKYVEGHDLKSYMSKKKLNKKQKDDLKKKIHEKINKLSNLCVNVDVWNNGVVIDKKNNIHILAGLNTINTHYSKYNVNHIINTNGYKTKKNTMYIKNYPVYTVLNNMLNKKIMQFK